jgi:hypothetical protein
MTNKTWLGGGNNQANNPNDWSPVGVPASPDVMNMSQGTMNIDNFALSATAFETPLHISGNVSLNLSHNSTVFADVNFGQTTINIHDDDTMGLQTHGGSATVNLTANSQWIGGFVAEGGTITVNGAPHAAFINSDQEQTAPRVSGFVDGGGTKVDIRANIKGTGAIQVSDNGSLDVGGSVSAGQTVILEPLNGAVATGPPGFLQVDHPDQFNGAIDLGEGEIDLNGLAKADSYTYQNDLLSIFHGKSVIDTLRLNQIAQDLGVLPFAVEKTTAGVSIYTTSDPTHPPGTALPAYV